MTTPGFDIGEETITGSHLIDLQHWAGFDVTEMTAALGINYQKWFQLTRDNPHEPISDPDLSLMIWAAYAFPVESGFVRPPTPQTVYAKYEEVAKRLDKNRSRSVMPKKLTTYRMFALMLGRDGANGYRWLSDTDSVPVSVTLKTRRLMTAFYNILSKHGVKGLRQWLNRVNLEIKQRELDDLWKRGSWQPPKPKEE